MSKPRIRFKGFEQEWGSCKLGEHLYLRRGLTYCPDDVVDKGVRVLRSSNIQDGLLTFNDDDVFVTHNAAVKIEPVQCGNILITAANGSKSLVGKHCIISGRQEHMVHGGFMLLGETAIPKYLNASMYAPWFKEEVRIHSAGGNGSISNLNKKDVDNFYTEIPSETTEIAEIGDFFSYFDNLYSALLDKITSLKSLKICYLNRLFPIGGGNEPPVRLAGFSGEWIEKKLGDCFEERNERSSEGELLSVTISDGIKRFSELNRRDSSSKDKSNYKVVKKGDIVYNSMRMWQGASGCSEYDGIVSPAYTVLIPKAGINPHFFAFFFKNPALIDKFRIYSQGLTSDTWNLKYPSFSQIAIRYPESMEEQGLLSNFLSEVNNLLHFHEEELERLKALKESCLQGMFV